MTTKFFVKKHAIDYINRNMCSDIKQAVHIKYRSIFSQSMLLYNHQQRGEQMSKH